MAVATATAAAQAAPPPSREAAPAAFDAGGRFGDAPGANHRGNYDHHPPRRRPSRWGDRDDAGHRSAPHVSGNLMQQQQQPTYGSSRYIAHRSLPEVGSVVRSTVLRVTKFGVFVRLMNAERHNASPVDALVHSSNVSDELRFSRDDADEDRIKAMEWMCNAGESVWVQVLEVAEDRDGGRPRVSCSIKSINQDDGTRKPSNERAAATHAGNSDERELPDVGSIHRASVVKIMPFGVFVKVHGYRRHALVHPKQISGFIEMSRDDTDEAKVAALSEVVSIDEEIFVKIIDVKQGTETSPARVAASLKVVNQTTGADLDPHMLSQQRQARGGDMYDAQRVGAGAGAVTTSGKIDWGHLTGDVRQMGGKAYDLVVDDAEVVHPDQRQPVPDHRRSPAVASMGRGRATTLPAWMTSTSTGPDATTVIGGGSANRDVIRPAEGGSQFRDLDEARAVLLEYEDMKRDRKRRRDEDRRSRNRHKDDRRHGASRSGGRNETDRAKRKRDRREDDGGENRRARHRR